MTINKNKCFVNGSISYVSQRPWIQNSTVKDGILFARDYDHDEYKRVVKASQLASDLLSSDSDETEIGNVELT